MLGLDFLRQKEKFLLLEIAPRRTSGLLLSVDGDKNIRAEKFWEEFSFKKLRGDPLKSLRKRQTIVSAHPEFVSNIVVPALLEREEPNFAKPLSLHELETLFSQTLGRMQAKYRAEASARLGLDGLDTVLVGAKVSNFKIDGHMVLNPIGFSGKSVSAILELTFSARRIFDDLKEFFKASEGFFFTSAPRAALFALSKLGAPPINLAILESGQSFYFMLDKAAWGHAIREAKAGWSLSGIFDAIAREFHLSPKMTFAVYDKFLGNETSDKFSRSLEKTLKTEKDALLAELKKMNPRGALYLHSQALLPLKLPMRLGGATLEEPPLDNALERFGFRLERADWPFGRSESFMRLAPFFEFYFDKSDSEINRRLRRKLHWLIQ